MNGPLDVAFVWHMHQPYYKISDTGAYEMPWVRMHALKDYARMVDMLTGRPGLHQTFNLVPSLVEQLLDYARGEYIDTYREHVLRPAEDLTPGERAFLLETMCERPTHPRAKNNLRYLDLAQKRDRSLADGVVRVEEFSVEEIRDLQVWFDLAWFDPQYLRDGPLAELAARGRDFVEEDKALLVTAEAELLSRVLPTYGAAFERGVIELSTSPYYHPILPLLCNTDLARVSLPAVELPTRRFAHPEDAREHVRLALARHRDTFGHTPRGMWCSEQGVGEDVVGLLAEAGIAWTVSDETVLARSLPADRRRERDAGALDPRLLYRAHRLEREEGTLDIVFRDRTLSDLIGFTYQPWDPADAAGDLLHRLRSIRDALPDGGRGHLVTIALDGENAWEYYRDNGRDFLARLYDGLEAEPTLRCVTVSEHLADHPAAQTLPWLHSGSWIGGDFGTWMGDAAHRPAWDLLHDARDAVAAVRTPTRDSRPPGAEAPEGGTQRAGLCPADPHTEYPRPACPDSAGPRITRPLDTEPAWREILIAEGSDWFWWFSDHQESGLDYVWDAAFRRHLQQAYRLAGLAPPAALFAPLLSATAPSGAGNLTATVDGLVRPEDEWRHGIALRPAGTGTMQRSTRLPVGDLRFGWDAENLFFLIVPTPNASGRVDVAFYLGVETPPPETSPADAPSSETPPSDAADMLGFQPAWKLALTFVLPGGTAPTAHPLDWTWETLSERALDGMEAATTDGTSTALVRAAAGDVAEVALPARALGEALPRSIRVGAVLFQDGHRIETYPSGGALDMRWGDV